VTGATFVAAIVAVIIGLLLVETLATWKAAR
jgi:hypothetical protein